LDFIIVVGVCEISNVINLFLNRFCILFVYAALTGYPNISNVAEVVANYSAFDIPLEAQWLDIDYMKAYLDFTVDPINFPLSDMQSFVSQLHSNNQRFVPIIDPAIYVLDNTYEAYTTGVADEVFVKDYTGTKEYLGQVFLLL
jgi:alpha-glucosidase